MASAMLHADPDRALFYRQVGKRLADARTAQGVSQNEIGRQIGVDQSIISRMEMGQRAIRLDEFMSWCDALSLEPIHILGEAKKMHDTTVAIGPHQFVGVDGDDWCATCELPPTDPIHKVEPEDDN